MRSEKKERGMATASFQQIAMKAHARFSGLPAFDTAIQLVPLNDGGKRPAKDFLPNIHQVTKTIAGIELAAAVYPTANVGVRSRREVGAVMAIDCDESGVVERIERETGNKLPLTYTTLTRPESAPHKMHLVYLSTPYSVQKIRKQVMDVTHVAGYDLKGCGGFGHICAEGCIRDGETVVALHDVDFAPIPDWLVDWLCSDVAKARAQKKAKPQPPRPSPARTTLRPNVVPHDHRNWTIKSRVRTWKNTGMSDDQVLMILVDHIRKFFEDGESLLDKAGMKKLRATIRKTKTLGSIAYANLLHTRRTRNPKRKPKAKPLATMRELFKTCPAQISSVAARRFFSIQSAADELRLLREFKRHGYVSHGPQGSHERVWIRQLSPDTASPTKSLSSLSPLTPKPSTNRPRAHDHTIRM
jgi:hypothetical protein